MTPDSNRNGNEPEHPFLGDRMQAAVQQFADTQKLLGANWPQSEYLLCRLLNGEFRFRKFTPSDSAYPHFERPFKARQLMLARNRSAGWTIGHR